MIYRSILFTCLWIGVSVATVAQTRIGVGVTYDDSGIQDLFGSPGDIKLTYFPDSSNQTALTLSVEHFLMDHLSFLFDVQLIGGKRYRTDNSGFVISAFHSEKRFIRGGFIGRYRIKDWLFVGGGPSIQYNGKFERKKIVGIEQSHDNVSEQRGTRRFGVQVQTGVFYKGFELQLAYYFSPFYKERIDDFGYFQSDLLQNQFSPTLRYSYNIGKKEKRRRGR